MLFSFRLLFFLLFQNEISNKMSRRSTFPQQHSDTISFLQAVELLAINIIALVAFFFNFRRHNNDNYYLFSNCFLSFFFKKGERNRLIQLKQPVFSWDVIKK